MYNTTQTIKKLSARGMTQKEIAGLLDIDQSTVSRHLSEWYLSTRWEGNVQLLPCPICDYDHIKIVGVENIKDKTIIIIYCEKCAREIKIILSQHEYTEGKVRVDFDNE